MPQGEANSAKTECPKKHEYTPENTINYEYKSGLTKRVCRKCAQANARVQRLKRYGLTLESYEAMLASQDYRCKLCRSEFKNSRDENIDHDHACCDRDGSCGDCIRGILCGECNRGLARFKDSAALLIRAADYVLRRLDEVRLDPGGDQVWQHGRASVDPDRAQGHAGRADVPRWSREVSTVPEALDG